LKRGDLACAGAGGRIRCHASSTALGHEDIAAVQRAVRTRVLRLFARGGLITPETTAQMHPKPTFWFTSIGVYTSNTRLS
jgi:hypothetical protein